MVYLGVFILFCLCLFIENGWCMDFVYVWQLVGQIGYKGFFYCFLVCNFFIVNFIFFLLIIFDIYYGGSIMFFGDIDVFVSFNNRLN